MGPVSGSVCVVGRGRAGGSFFAALASAGWDAMLVASDEVVPTGAALVLLCVPDAAVADVAARLPVDAGQVVSHCAGSLGLEVLAPHPRRASIHPLVALAEPTVGAELLAGGATFAVAGDPIARSVVDALGGHAIEVDDDVRSAYHAAACIASNHVVALLGQAERVAAAAGVPLAAYLDLVRGTVDNVVAFGPAAALTGPASRHDIVTLEAHRAALDPTELGTYDAMVAECVRLADAATAADTRSNRSPGPGGVA